MSSPFASSGQHWHVESSPCRGGSPGQLPSSLELPDLLAGPSTTQTAAHRQSDRVSRAFLSGTTGPAHAPSRQVRGHLCEDLVKHRPEGQEQWCRFGSPRGGSGKRGEGATSQTGSHVSSVGAGPAQRPGQERIGERDVKGAGAGLVAAAACAVLPGTLRFLRGGTKGFLFSKSRVMSVNIACDGMIRRL